MRSNNIMTINQITELEITSFMYKYKKGMLTPCFDHFFQNNLKRKLHKIYKSVQILSFIL